MNAGLAHTIESLFGPPSELVDISLFLESPSPALTEDNADTPEVYHAEVVSECSVSEIRESLFSTWSNPILSAHLIKDHDHMVSALHSLNQKTAKPARKTHLPDPDTLPIEVTTLQKNLDAVSLNSFRLKTDAVMFMRTPKNSDRNVLQSVKVAPESGTLPNNQEVVITISIYNKIPWGPSYVTRSSQHVFVSSQTLQDVYDSIVCETKHLPQEAGMSDIESGCILCIEGIAYGAGNKALHYPAKLLELLSKKKAGPVSISPASQQETMLRSLSLRINEPYWMVHHGNCEHFIIVNQIRYHHPSDPRGGYPLTLQIAPPMLDLCRACAKIPALWSVVGDVRLGESPCLLCGPCWRNMGESKDEGVTVLPLVKYTYL